MGAAYLQVVGGRASGRFAPGSYLPNLCIEGQVEHGPIVVQPGQTTVVRLQLVPAVLRTLRYDFTAVGLPMRAYATFHKNGEPLQRTWYDFWRDGPTAMEHRCTPGSWELELELGDGRVQRFPFVVSADAEAPVIDIRVLP